VLRSIAAFGRKPRKFHGPRDVAATLERPCCQTGQPANRPAVRRQVHFIANQLASVLNDVMQNPNHELIRTRTTLINRLKNWQDQASWQDFFDTYWKLIYGVAVKSGLTGTEAQDVVQETMFSVAKHMPNFKYDRKTGSFKAWLMTMTRWRISDQFRKRDPVCRSHTHSDNNSKFTTADTLDNIPDRTDLDLEAQWDAEWKIALIEAAMAKVKRNIAPEHYQVFDLYVNKGWEPDRIAKTFGIAVGQVYLRKHRVSEAFKVEVERLKTEVT
jgi:RNA polymerase sigma-70 factor (ECF subfamily)